MNRHSAFAKLTPRQADVLDALLKGHSDKIIARELNLAAPTVKHHTQAVYRALGVTSRAQAIAKLSQREPLSDEQRIRIRAEALTIEDAIDMTEAAHGIGGQQ